MFHLVGVAEIEILMCLFNGGLPSSPFLCCHIILLKCCFGADSFVSKYMISLALKFSGSNVLF